LRRTLGLEEKHQQLDFQQTVFLPTETTIPEIPQAAILNSAEGSVAGAIGEMLQHARKEAAEGTTEEGGKKPGDPNRERTGLLTFVETARIRRYTRQKPEVCEELIRRGVVDNYQKVQNITKYLPKEEEEGGGSSEDDGSSSDSDKKAVSTPNKPTTQAPPLSLHVRCRWLRYPTASSFPVDIENHAISSVGIRNSEESNIFQAVHTHRRNEDFFRNLLGWYIQEHQLWREGKSEVLRGAIIAVCYGLPYCGGHGDRVHGILSLFLLAMATNRGFLIDSRFPVPLETALLPSFLDWRVRSEEVELNNRVQLVDLTEEEVERELRGLRRSPEVIAVGTNLRLHSIAAEWLREEHGWFALTSAWVSDAWNHLFKPTEEILRGLEPTSKKPFLALHFRAGNETLENFVDPARHGLDLIGEFLRCAKQVEGKLSVEHERKDVADLSTLEEKDVVARKAVLDAGTPWYLAADTGRVWDHPAVKELVAKGKVVPFPSLEAEQQQESSKDVYHVDRSPASLTISNRGFHRSWTEYLALSRATALVISNSFFGETAGEVGNVPFVYYGDGCVEVDL